MKKTVIFLLAVLVLAGCQKKTDKPAANKPNAATETALKAIDNPNQGFFLRYKFTKDKKYQFRLTNISTSSQYIKADTAINQQAKQQIIYVVDVTAKEIDKDSTAELSINISKIDMTVEAGGKTIKYQAGHVADKKKYAEFEALLNNPFNVTVSKTGEVTDVFRVDRIVNSLVEIGGGTGKVTTEQKNMIKQQVIESGLKPILVQLFRKVPYNAIAKDTTWENPQPAGKYLSYVIQPANKFKIANLQLLGSDKVAVIDAGLTAKIKGQEKVSEKGISYDIKKPIVYGEGSVYFNISKGMIQKSKTSSRTEMNISMEGPSPKGGKQKLTRKEVTDTMNILELL